MTSAFFFGLEMRAARNVIVDRPVRYPERMPGPAADDPPVGKSGPGIASRISPIVNRDIVDEQGDGGAGLGQVVWRNAGRHADGDAVGAG